MNTEQSFQIWEAVFFAFVNSFPYISLVVFSFRKRWRYDKKVIMFLVSVVTIIQIIVTVARLYGANNGNPLLEVLVCIIYAIFVFRALKEPAGKLVFTVLVLMNVGNFVIVSAKYLEGLFFPSYALLRYHFTYPLFMILILLFLLPVCYFLIFKDICPNVPGHEEEESGCDSFAARYMWHYMWFIPAVFHLIWMQYFYGSGKSRIENALDPFSTGYLLLIDAGSVMIYRIVVELVALQENNARLQTMNHALSIQNVQYQSLQKRLEEARRARHDLRHHIVLLKNIRDTGNFEALDELLNSYPDISKLEQRMLYCENLAVNTVLLYFAELASERGICFSVKLDLPSEIFIDNTELVVLFGNLLENALEACEHKKMTEDRFIKITGQFCLDSLNGAMAALTIENSYEIPPHIYAKDKFRSTKHNGNGIGIESVRSIVSRYHGTSSFSAQKGIFTASLLLYADSEN